MLFQETFPTDFTQQRKKKNLKSVNNNEIEGKSDCVSLLPVTFIIVVPKRGTGTHHINNIISTYSFPNISQPFLA